MVELCNELRLGAIAAQYTALARKAAEKRASFTDFIEELLACERESRRTRAREMFARIACFPAIKDPRPIRQHAVAGEAGINGESFRLKDKRKAGLLGKVAKH